MLSASTTNAPGRIRRVISRLFPKKDVEAEELAPLPALFIGLYARENVPIKRYNPKLNPCFLLVIDGDTWRYYPRGLDTFGEGFADRENTLDVQRLPALRTYRLQCVEALDLQDSSVTEARIRETLQAVRLLPLQTHGKMPDRWMVDAIKALQTQGIVVDSIEADDAYANVQKFAAAAEPFRGHEPLPTCSMTGSTLPSVAPEPATIRADGALF